MKKICILATGGTISGVAQAPTQYSGYQPASLDVTTLLANIPIPDHVVSIEAEQVLNSASHDITESDLILLSCRLKTLVASQRFTGIVVTVGTNTLDEVAFFLHLTVTADIPIVLVGSMRPSNSLSADGPLNLYRAMVVASSTEAIGRGILVVCNERIMAAKDIVKSDVMSTETFSALDKGLVGVVIDNTVHCFNAPNLSTLSVLDVNPRHSLPKVGIIYGHIGESDELFNFMVNSHYSGIVYAGPGTAAVTSGAKIGIKRCKELSIPVVRVARAAKGLVTKNMEFNDEVFGTVSGMGLPPQKARMLLQLILLINKSNQRLQPFFDRYI